MATSKKFSELTAASSLTANDLAAVAHVDAQAETGYESQKATMSQLGQYLNKEMQYATDLSKFPVGSQSPIPALNNLRDFLYGQLPVNSASGSIANFTTSLALPLVALKAYIQAQGGGGTPSAPVAITGFDSIKIYQRGVNLWDEEWETGSIDNTTGQNNNLGTNRIRSKNYIPVSPNVSYNFVSLDTTYAMFLYFYDENKNFISIDGNVTRPNYVFTTPADCYYVRFRSNDNFGAYDNSISINYPSTDTQYHAYNPNSTEYTIQLGQTCYGGYIDKESGKLVIDSAFKTFDGTETFTSSTNNRFFYTVDDVIQPTVSTSDLVLCSHFVSRTQSQQDDQAVWKTTGNKIIVFRDTSIADLTAWTNFLTTQYNNGTPVQLAYKLATPISTDITIPDITALVGENNIWADSGNIEVSFKQGIQEYIDAKIAETQALIL